VDEDKDCMKKGLCVIIVVRRGKGIPELNCIDPHPRHSEVSQDLIFSLVVGGVIS
jgi:hypothetical protein